jgi:xylulokinase
VTQDANDWYPAAARAVSECLAQMRDVRIEGLGITAPAHYAVLLGARNEVLCRVLIASDRRPAGIARRLSAEMGRGYFDKTRMEMNSTLTLPQLVWLRESGTVAWNRVRRVLVAKDYLRHRIAGGLATDPSDATGTGIYDQVENRWDPELLEIACLTYEQVAPVLPATAPVGRVNKEFAQMSGLRAGVPVVVGATDTASELISLGATRAGATVIKIASTGTVVVVQDVLPDDRRLLNYPHAQAGFWYSAGVTNTAAVALDWVARVVGLGELSSPEARLELNRIARAVPAGSDGLIFLPYLEGRRNPVWDPKARGAFVGLSSAHDRGHLVRAVLEGVAMSLRECRDAMTGGASTVRPLLAGGGVANSLWRSILVSVLGKEATLVDPQGPAIGAAMLASRATAQAGTVRSVARPVARRTRVVPRPEWAEAYETSYRAFIAAGAAMEAGPAAELASGARSWGH